MNKEDNYFLYMGLNEFSVPRFLSFSYSNHQCKINLEDNLLEKNGKKEDWFLEEFNYHRSIEDIKKFVFDFEKHKDIRNILSEDSITKIKNKIKTEQIDLKKSEIKNFTLLLKVFLEMFSVRRMFVAYFFEYEFLEFVKFIFKNIGFYRSIFENYETNFKNLLILLFQLEHEKIYFLIKDDSFCSKDVKWCFQGLAKKKINKKFENIEDNSIFFRDNFWNLFIWIWKFDSTNKEWFFNCLNLLIKNRDTVNPWIFISILEKTKTELKDKEIKKLLNFDVNYNTLINQAREKLNFDWIKFPMNVDNYKWNIMKLNLLKSQEDYLQDPHILMNIFAFPFHNDVVNKLSSGFGFMNSESKLAVLFESKDYTNSQYQFFIPGINFMMGNVYLPIFANREQFVFNYFNSTEMALNFIFSKLSVSKKEQQKIFFFIKKFENILSENNWLDKWGTAYDIANYSISIIEYLLLITYQFEFTDSFDQLPKINLDNKNKTRISFLIKAKGTECKKSTINRNLFLSVDTLDFIYFNLYSSKDEGGLDFRNRLVHHDWEFSELINLPIRLMFLTFSIIEEIALNALKLLTNKK